MASAVVVRVRSYQSLRQVYPALHVGILVCRNVWISASVIVPLLKKTASLMMLPGWNFDRSAILTGPPSAVSKQMTQWLPRL